MLASVSLACLLDGSLARWCQLARWLARWMVALASWIGQLDSLCSPDPRCSGGVGGGGSCRIAPLVVVPGACRIALVFVILAAEDRRDADARLPSLRLKLTSDPVAAQQRLQDRLEVALNSARGLAQLELEHHIAAAKRLRGERDRARADALRYNEERNALRREVAELRVRQSETAVRDASRTRLSFPGTPA